MDTITHPAPSPVDLIWRTAYRMAFPLARMWWQLRRPQHEGALVAIRVGPDLLLVRPSYRKEWNLPGGGIRTNEAPEAAARRELEEELGLIKPMLISVGVVHGLWDGRQDRVHLFELELDALPALRLDNREVVAARLVKPHELNGMALTGPVMAYLARERGAEH